MYFTKQDLTAEQVRHLLHYAPSTGVLTWKRTGRVAGSLDQEGYRAISVRGSGYRAHRLAWLHYHGEWPKGVIDHINGQKDDNRVANLRDVSILDNSLNSRPGPIAHNKTSASRGVSWQPSRRKWLASIQANGKSRTIGRFDTEAEAAEAYNTAKRLLHPSAPDRAYNPRPTGEQ